jgi:Gpi18-like mannosyltransferase
MTKYLGILLTLGLIFRLVISTAIYSGDLNNHFKWGEGILKYGFLGAYEREYPGVMQPTYPPVSLYAFTTSTGLYQLVHKISWYLNRHLPLFPSTFIWLIEDQDMLPAFNKTIAMVSDIGVSLVIYCLVRRIKPKHPTMALIASAAYLFNPAVWYTSTLWGQIESLPLFFVLLAIYLAYFQPNPIYSHISFVGSLLSKQSSIIFIPVFTLLSLSKFGVKKTLIGFGWQLAVFYLVFLPFYGLATPLQPFNTYINRIQTGSGSNWVTDHAFNPWAWMTHFEKIADTTPVLFSYSAQYVGLILFFISSGSILLLYLLRKKTPQNTFFVSLLISLFSFVVLTKMHERYLL